jgi:UDP-N-acetylmuramoyl-L-alanyl-D-glutamate--2,6-diaminopimelate ligase
MRPAAVTPILVADLVGPASAAAEARLDGLAVTGATHDSRRVRPGDLYFGVPGRHVHGGDFAAEAAAAGAGAMISDRPDRALPTIVVDDARAMMGPLSARVYGHPSRAVTLLGVTGTNGKTTTTYLLEAGLRAARRRTGLVGTIAAHVGERSFPSAHTTPEAPDLQALLALMRESSVDAAAIEVSSHGLALGRVDGTRFAAAIFTNLTHEHLDFHGDMEHYLAAKAMLFERERCGVAVIDVDDPFGARLAASVPVPVVTTSSQGRRAAWQATDVRADGWSTRFTLYGPDVRRDVHLQMPGRFNVDNALGAIAAVHAVGVDVDDALDGMQRLAGVPGRLQRVRRGQPFEAVVDYAHNPDALDRALAAVREMTSGRVIAVLGAPGDRDRTKRPMMGRIAAARADLVIVTDDDPWSEDPALIREAVLRGTRARPAASVLCFPDREQAIAVAVGLAGPGDAVLVAGRGHERQQVYDHRTVAFDDVAVLAAHLDARAAREGRTRRSAATHAAAGA